MTDKILIDMLYPQEVRVALVSKNNKILHFDYESSAKKQLKGNIYLAKITRVEPSLQAAFVEYGKNKHGFLPFSEIHPDYYQIPESDKNASKDNKEEEKAKAPEPEKIADKTRLQKIVNSQEKANNDNNKTEEEEEDLTKKYKIQEVIKKNQLVLVQVIKEERGNKGVSLSTFISLAGRYCVLIPNSLGKLGGISRRIENISDRKRLRELLKSFNIAKGANVILRTAVADKSDDEIREDYEYLVNIWNNIRKDTVNANAPALIHQEADIIKRSIQDVYNSNVSEIIVEGDEGFRRVKKLAQIIIPSAEKKIKLYKNKASIFKSYKIEDEINNFYSPIASLESGGYIVINITEALISIDVNSGKANKERSVEETAVKTNLEAAREVARQLQLRDLSGLVVIDFIDMIQLDNRKAVERELRDALAGDKARVQFNRISSFGLVEMSRQRLRPSLIETNMVNCPNCNGTGYVKSFESLSVDIFRAIRNEVLKNKVKSVKIFTAGNVLSYINNYKRKNIAALENQHNINIFFEIDNYIKGEFKITTANDLSQDDKEMLENDKIFFNSNVSKQLVAVKESQKNNLVHKLFGKLK